MTDRCAWCGDDPLYVAYHDTEWGVPVRDGRALWEMLTLEAFQAGLSWITILRKRDGFRAAFAGFDPVRVAAFDDGDILRLLADPGIVRHRGKIEATIANAKAYLRIEAQHPGGFADLVWGVVDGRPLQTCPDSLADVPGQTDLSVALSKALKSQGFRFCGPTTCYAFMQAAGLVNDHVASCFRQAQVQALSA